MLAGRPARRVRRRCRTPGRPRRIRRARGIVAAGIDLARLAASRRCGDPGNRAIMAGIDSARRRIFRQGHPRRTPLTAARRQASAHRSHRAVRNRLGWALPWSESGLPDPPVEAMAPSLADRPAVVAARPAAAAEAREEVEGVAAADNFLLKHKRFFPEARFPIQRGTGPFLCASVFDNPTRSLPSSWLMRGMNRKAV